MKIVGVDPGFASMGLAIIDADTMVVEVLKVLHTKKGSKKVIKNLRVADDDCRRLKELQEVFCSHLPKEEYILSIEAFSSFKGGYKAGMGYAMTVVVANADHRPVFVFVPQDIKREICGKVKSSKKKVQDKIFDTFGINEGDFNKGDLEHIADALALTLLGKKQVEEIKQIMGE